MWISSHVVLFEHKWQCLYPYSMAFHNYIFKSSKISQRKAGIYWQTLEKNCVWVLRGKNISLVWRQQCCRLLTKDSNSSIEGFFICCFYSLLNPQWVPFRMRLFLGGYDTYALENNSNVSILIAVLYCPV